MQVLRPHNTAFSKSKTLLNATDRSHKTLNVKRTSWMGDLSWGSKDESSVSLIQSHLKTQKLAKNHKNMHSPALKTKPLKATDYKIEHTIPVQIRKHKLSGQWKRPGSNPLPGRKIIFTFSFQIPSKEPFTRKGATTNFSVARRRQRDQMRVAESDFKTWISHNRNKTIHTQQGCCEVTSFLLVWPGRKWAGDVKRLAHNTKIHTHTQGQMCVSEHVFSQTQKPLDSQPNKNKSSGLLWFKPTCLRLCHFTTQAHLLWSDPPFVEQPADSHRSDSYVNHVLEEKGPLIAACLLCSSSRPGPCNEQITKLRQKP